MTCTVTFDGEALTGAIECEDPSPLRDLETRGNNVPVPYVDGTVPFEPYLHELDRTLVWLVNGRVAPITGTPHSDRELGVADNLEHYRSLFDPRGGAAGTGEYAISVTLGDNTFSGLAQVKAYSQVRTGPTTAKIVTRLVIAAGELVSGS